MENWKDVLGFEGCYRISDLGSVESLDRYVASKNGSQKFIKGKFLKPRPGKKGYLRVQLSQFGISKDFYVHRLVAAHFIGPAPEGLDVCHYDNDISNNNVKNLRYDTRLGNMADQKRHNTHWCSQKTHCRFGHALEIPNLVVWKLEKEGKRCCLACERTRTLRTKIDPTDFQRVSDEKHLAIIGST